MGINHALTSKMSERKILVALDGSEHAEYCLQCKFTINNTYYYFYLFIIFTIYIIYNIAPELLVSMSVGTELMKIVL